MNRGTLRTQVADFVGDPNQTRFTVTQYNNAINRAQEQFAMETKTTFKYNVWTTADGDSQYDLPSDFMWEEWVTYDGSELKPISRHELNRLNPGFDWSGSDITATPTHFVIDPEEINKQIRPYPTPNDAKTLVMRYFAIPTEMSADTDTPLNTSSLMAQFHMGIAAFSAWILLTGETITPEIQYKRNELMQYYTDSVVKAVDTFKNTASAGIKIKGSRLWK